MAFYFVSVHMLTHVSLGPTSVSAKVTRVRLDLLMNVPLVCLHDKTSPAFVGTALVITFDDRSFFVNDLQVIAQATPA